MNLGIGRVRAAMALGVLAVLLAGGCDKQDAAPAAGSGGGGNAAGGKADREAIVGTWIPTSVNEAGRALGDGDSEMHRPITFKDGAFEWEMSGTYALTADASPKVIDLYFSGGRRREQIRMTYALRGDELTLALKEGAATRPYVEATTRSSSVPAAVAPPTPGGASGFQVGYTASDLTPGPMKKVYVFRRAG